MLPYGTLWKLDQMLHPVAPPQRRTLAMRRRQALFYFLWGILLVTVFLFPFHYASLRRLRLDGARRLRGASPPEVDASLLQSQQERSLERLTKRMAAQADATGRLEVDGVSGSISVDLARVFYHHPGVEVRLRGMFDHPFLRGLAGNGSGKLWKNLGNEAATAAERGGSVTPRRPSVAQVASIPSVGGATGKASCLLSLRRDYVVSRFESTAGVEVEPLRALQEAISRFDKLDSITVSRTQSRTPQKAAGGTSTETAVARLLLWIANDAVLADEALSRVVAGCTTPLSRSLNVSLSWQPLSNHDLAQRRLVATVQELEEAPMQYVCLCSGKALTHAVVLEHFTGDDGAAPTLSLVDPRRVEGTGTLTCTHACNEAETIK